MIFLMIKSYESLVGLRDSYKNDKICGFYLNK